MKTIKLIDLLNKIEKGEEVPKKIWLRRIWRVPMTYSEEAKDYYCTNNPNGIFEDYFKSYNKEDFNLNEEVEIIEEEKEIEKLDVELLGQCDNWLRCPTNKVTKQDVELNPYIIENIRENTLYFQRKINELIGILNEIRKEK